MCPLLCKKNPTELEFEKMHSTEYGTPAKYEILPNTKLHKNSKVYRNSVT